ncbi:3-oxoacyl-[acyl-carrier protein] reductase [Tumebacillus sp. BK434]|uniref:elongation factor P 5-aminopentanone reductase n=1 Tax=Tumebacillus sp. BK434 TaxID=2512169 RepID=UPI0010F0AA5B|nr:SDR family oxidoreductase [Tumebacillus sp. BK434]TCP52904.1 3-oxoacyl-[acyl-carrier protein] reductase [Tumebacillus sp. BK434]
MNRLEEQPLRGAPAIVTGASRGIGRAIAISLAEAGANVIVNYNQSAQAAEETVEACRRYDVKALAVRADLSDPAQAAHLIEATCVNFGAPQILVNNAGISRTGLLLDTTVEEWDEMMHANLRAPFLCAKAVLPHMVQRQYGRIINLSSIWGITGGSCEVAYSASKGGIISFTKALAKEVGPSGITVNCVAPGAVMTDMLSHLSQEDLERIADETPVGRIGTPQDIANLVRFLALPASSFITGQVVSPNGGLVT